MSSEIWQLDAAATAHGIRTGQFSSREATESCLARLDAVNPRLNAVVDVLREEALATADKADAKTRSQENLPALHGVPVTVKINVDWTGRPTDNGVAAFKDLIAPGDSSSMRSWRRAGAVVIGRTNAPAFSMRAFTGNELHGLTLNPWDKTITSGGSSGGASSAVAAGIGTIGHGNDIGGSVRYPAYCTGIFGIRPTMGRVGAFNPSGADRLIGSQLMSVQGVLSRSVRDLRLGLDAMAARDERDVWQVPTQPVTGLGPRARRAAVWMTGHGKALHPSVAEALRKTAAWLADAGWEVVEAGPPSGLEAVDLWGPIIMSENRYALLPLVEKHGDAAIKSFMGDVAEMSAKLDLEGYLKALQRRTALLRDWTLFLEQYPVLVTPVSAVPPMPTDGDLGGMEASRRAMEGIAFMLQTATLGLPGVSAPTGSVGTVPMGVQLVSARFDEASALAAAEVIEARAPAVQPIDPSWT
ncbi:amidase [Ferrovibrio terrae]|uniref:amidase n=1 Tax=Ferrovibrio terrae TaxID=2594003 RepID=UPI0031382D64